VSSSVSALCLLDHLVPGRHRDGCTEQACTGCVPALAAAGILVCSWHENRARSGLRDLPGLYADLGDPRRSPAPSQGTRRSDSGAALPLDDHRRHTRSSIRSVLVWWCQVLAGRDPETVGDPRFVWTLPPDTVTAMAHHIATKTGFILATEWADQLVHDITTVTSDAWRLARPGRRPAITVPCPICAHRVPLRPNDAGDVTCTECGEHGDIRWWRHQLAPNIDAPMPAPQLCTWLLEHHRIRTAEPTLRTWAHRGKISAAGRDAQGRTLYDPVQVAAYALQQRAQSA
jgi:hypothetical protein